MHVLIVCSGNKDQISPFVKEQVESLIKLGIKASIFTIKGKGVFGYLRNYPRLSRSIIKIKPDIIHAHYGLSGLLSNLQRKIPVITTFHGSDINNPAVFFLSRLAHRYSKVSIFVGIKMQQKMTSKPQNILIPCGVDINGFKAIDEYPSKLYTSTTYDGYTVLFSSSFDNKIKNYPLAKKACEITSKNMGKEIFLKELKGYSRKEVNRLLIESNCILLTSMSEGSPQFIKEAMACNRPIVSTSVGDIGWLFGSEPGHFLSSFDPEDVASKIQAAIEYSDIIGQTNGRQRIIELGLDSENIAQRLVTVYNNIIRSNK